MYQTSGASKSSILLHTATNQLPLRANKQSVDIVGFPDVLFSEDMSYFLVCPFSLGLLKKGKNKMFSFVIRRLRLFLVSSNYLRGI